MEEVGALHTEVFSRFVNESLPAVCSGDCGWASHCHDTWVLLGTGEVRPMPSEMSFEDIDPWAIWHLCPRRFKSKSYALDQGLATISECCRWAVECALHQRTNLSPRASYLLREYTRIKGLPSALRQKMMMDEIKATKGPVG